MTGARPKTKFYAVTNGREIGIFTNWTRASDSVVGFAKAKYKGFCTYSEAVTAMECAGFETFCVYDGQDMISRAEYENSRTKVMLPACETKDAGTTQTSESSCTNSEASISSKVTTHTVYIDGSCVGNGANNAKAGIGLFWGDNHPWNISKSLNQEDGEILTNNKAELRAAIRAVEIAREHKLSDLVINSDSKYVVLGITEWINQWQKNNWKTSSGEKVKNKDEWMRLNSLVQESNVNITWVHVPGHSGIAGNEEADSLAVKGANGNSQEYQSNVTNPSAPDIEITNRDTGMKEQTDKGKQKQNQATPIKPTKKDKSETPVPGSINGSNTSQKYKKGATITDNDNILTNEEDKLFKAFTNMETVLENVLLQVHQTRQENFGFKQEMTSTLEKLQSRQEVIEDSISNLSREFASNMHKTFNQIEKANKMMSEIERSSCASAVKEVKSEIHDLQKDFQSRIEMIKRSVQSTDIAVNDLKKDINLKSNNRATEIEQMHMINKDIQESATDTEVTFKNTTAAKADLSSSEDKSKTPAAESGQSNNDITKGGASGRSSNIVQSENIQDDSVKQNTSNGIERNTEKTESYQKPLVCLIGDSISGQVAASYLGKSTNTFVKKLRAPKITDIGQYSNDVKGSKAIVIHAGINDIREKETDSNIVSNLKEAVSILKKAAPEAKIIVSKLIPVGERGLEIERNILNAEAEKALSLMTDAEISYIDHSNLSDRGTVISDYYRLDELHLSKDGIYQYTGNLKDAIFKALRNTQRGSDNVLRQTTEPQTARKRHQSISVEGRYRKENKGEYYARDRPRRGYSLRKQQPHRYDRSGNGRYDNSRQQGYDRSGNRGYDNSRQQGRYTHQYEHSNSNDRRRREGDDSYYRGDYNNDSHRRHYGDRDLFYGDERRDYFYDRDYSHRQAYN